MSDHAAWLDELMAARAERVGKLTEPHGALALVESHFLTTGDAGLRINDIPATWSYDGTTVRARVDESALENPNALTLKCHSRSVGGAIAPGEIIVPEDGELSVQLAAAGTTRTPVDITARIAHRGGTTAIRVWRSDSVALQDFQSIDYFPINQQWVISGTYRAYRPGEAARDTEYTFAGIDIPYSHDAPGELEFILNGKDHHLPVYSTTDDGIFLVVVDQTRGNEVDQPMRALEVDFRQGPEQIPMFPGPGESRQVTIDFNRLTLFPCAFSEHFTCPLPRDANMIEARITAGERGVLKVADRG